MENNLKLLSKYWFVISNLEGWVLAAGPMVLVHIECIWTHHSITALLVTVVSQSWPRFLQKIEDFFGQINFSTKLLRWWFHEIFERFAKNVWESINFCNFLPQCALWCVIKRCLNYHSFRSKTVQSWQKFRESTAFVVAASLVREVHRHPKFSEHCHIKMQ